MLIGSCSQLGEAYLLRMDDIIDDIHRQSADISRAIRQISANLSGVASLGVVPRPRVQSWSLISRIQTYQEVIWPAPVARGSPQNTLLHGGWPVTVVSEEITEGESQSSRSRAPQRGTETSLRQLPKPADWFHLHEEDFRALSIASESTHNSIWGASSFINSVGTRNSEISRHSRFTTDLVEPRNSGISRYSGVIADPSLPVLSLDHNHLSNASSMPDNRRPTLGSFGPSGRFPGHSMGVYPPIHSENSGPGGPGSNSLPASNKWTSYIDKALRGDTIEKIEELRKLLSNTLGNEPEKATKQEILKAGT